LNLLDEIVRQCLEQHKGGEKFFDHLDKTIQEIPVVYDLFDSIKHDRKNIIVSGKFGVFFKNLFSSHPNIIVVSGGLRKNIKIKDLTYLEYKIKTEDYIFIDDSFYSGKTRNAIKNEIERLGGKLINTYVIYDGSIERDISVSSLYRYYDNY